jgi:hypothetical protein
VAYFALFTVTPQVLLEQHENYNKRSYRNRTHLAGANGILRLSIPLLKGKNEQMPIREVRIANDQDWQRQHWNTIWSAYGKSPFFEYYAPEFEHFFHKKYTFLFDWNLDLLKRILTLLELSHKLSFTAEYSKKPLQTMDFRDCIHPKKDLNVTIPFFKPQKYGQVFEEKFGFLANLSILDLIFCAGPQAVLYLDQSINND